jgi:hypothetical protein
LSSRAAKITAVTFYRAIVQHRSRRTVIFKSLACPCAVVCSTARGSGVVNSITKICGFICSILLVEFFSINEQVDLLFVYLLYPSNF